MVRRRKTRVPNKFVLALIILGFILNVVALFKPAHPIAASHKVATVVTPTATPTASPSATPTPTEVSQAQTVLAAQTGWAEATQSYMLSLVNQARVANGLRPLVEIQVLDTSAYLKAQDESTKGYFSHTTPEGYSFQYFFRQAGFNYVRVAENLGRSYNDDNQLFQAFMNSPEHKANILEPNAIYFGFARVGNYSVMHFGGAF